MGMYDREAKAKLTGDLAHLYKEGRFEHEGVEVTGAGLAHMNGWYRRRETSEVPTRAAWSDWIREEWVRYTGGRQWYEKDDGCFIRWCSGSKRWSCWDGNDNARYWVRGLAVLPPAAGWRLCCEALFDPA